MYINKWRLDVDLTLDVRQSALGASEGGQDCVFV